MKVGSMVKLFAALFVAFAGGLLYLRHDIKAALVAGGAAAFALGVVLPTVLRVRSSRRRRREEAEWERRVEDEWAAFAPTRKSPQPIAVEDKRLLAELADGDGEMVYLHCRAKLITLEPNADGCEFADGGTSFGMERGGRKMHAEFARAFAELPGRRGYGWSYAGEVDALVTTEYVYLVKSRRESEEHDYACITKLHADRRGVYFWDEDNEAGYAFTVPNPKIWAAVIGDLAKAARSRARENAAREAATPISPRQAAYIRHLGGVPEAGMTWQQASALIDRLKAETGRG